MAERTRAFAHLWRGAAVAALAALFPLCPGCRCVPGGAEDDPKYCEGMRFFLAGNYGAATPLLRDFAAANAGSPRAAETHYTLGVMALRRAQAPEAETRFRQCLRSSPSAELAASAAVGLARCHFQRGAYRECREACLDILRTNPATPRADEVLFLLADAHDRLGEGAEARRIWRRVATEFRSSPLAAKAEERLSGAPATPAAAPGGRYSVQVAVLTSSAKADLHATLLRERGYPASVTPVQVQGASLHAVRVGPYATKAEAERMVARLRSEGFEAIIKP